ncbi:hypothetical protein PR001_g13026 [Phytophthora rubi]|uniref:Uncharacterized protein n=1 Tax=Phytophthora rubi TaxID=129364 RepID=A0A6A3LYV8_9STRA|nr:hypothetical protein PR001_g13026 [Phytophthora rubi]
MPRSDFSPQVCDDCGDAPCVWEQYKEIIGSRIRMLTSAHKRRAPRHAKSTLSQLYFYLKNGSLSKTIAIVVPRCVEKQIARLDGTIRRVCEAASPDAAAHTASRAERTLRELDVRASR